MFDLVLQKDSKVLVLKYDPHTSRLSFPSGDSFLESEFRLDYEPVPMVTPAHPLGKSQKLNLVKIQMGLKCNYNCSYCSQASQRGHNYDRIELAYNFLNNLSNWFYPGEDGKGLGVKVEFWGGEPFVYWKIMKILAEEIKLRYPNIEMSVITNGSLLDAEKIDWLDRLDFSVCISHDGPAMMQRGPDPLINENTRKIIKELHVKRSKHGKISFNTVLTRNNYSLSKVRKYISEKLDIPMALLEIGTEGPALLYDNAAKVTMARDEDEWLRMYNEICHDLRGFEGSASHTYVRKVEDFLQTLKYLAPSFSVGQKCGMDKSETIAVDLNGNVLTCQNTSADKGHKIGHLSDYKNIKLDTSWHWSARKECSECPVLQLCQGSCMFLQNELWDSSCELNYIYNLAFFSVALERLTGGFTLQKINGKSIRSGKQSLLFQHSAMGGPKQTGAIC